MSANEALVIVRRGREFLLLRRVPDDGGYWHVVSGAVEFGESPAEAAARELLEETGLAAVTVDLSSPFSYLHVFGQTQRRVRVEAFLADAPPGWEPRLNPEHDEFRWCGVGEADDLLRWPEPRELVRRVACGS